MKCGHCPIPPDLTCHGEDAARLCELVDVDGPIYDPNYLPSLWALARPIAERPAPPDVVEVLRLLRAMKGCPYRDPDPGCGCSAARCALRRGPVSHLDCFPCLRAYG